MRRIAVFRALQLGDMLCAVPALRALRARFAEAHVTLIGLPWASAFAERFSRYIDDFVAFPGFPGLPERAAEVHALPAFLARMQEQRFDLAVQMHGSGPLSNSVVALLGAQRMAALHGSAVSAPPGARSWPYPNELHEVRRNLALIGHLGGDPSDERLEFPIGEADYAELAEVPALADLRSQVYVCLHPGARSPDKRWPPECFAAVGDALAARGLRVVITGSAAEGAIARAVAGAMRAPAIEAACDISIGGLAALLAGARLVVTNDTGASHLAVALRRPSVVIFFATDPARWAPLDRSRHRVLHDPRGVRVAQVVDAIDDQLAAPSSASAAASTSSG